MTKSLIWKLAAVGLLALLLLIPLTMVRGLVSERQAYRQQALASIADGTAGSQLVAGPVWVLPYQQRMTEVTDEKTGASREVWRNYQVRILPDKLAVSGTVRTEPLRRGIYETRRYTAHLNISGQFKLPERAGLAESGNYRWGQPYLSVGLQDVRGIKATPTINWGQEVLATAPGAQLKALGNGVHADLPSYDGKADSRAFKLVMSLEGMDELNVLPLGRDTEVSLQSDWQHPSFIGRFLPESRDTGKAGFAARWRSSWFASNLNERFEQCAVGANEADCANFHATSLGVRLIEPVDVYLQSDRAVKYGFLFVFLTFCTFFLTEILKRVSIHPVQYGLVGFSLAIFFLLLLSFAEQWTFVPAYLAAAGACVLQNSFYASHILGSRWRGLGFGSLLAGLYGLLYVLLRSEDHALLLGSVLLFALLTVVMVLTRRLDWYALNGGESQSNHAEAA
ncbi:cell envelope integrity protein CreD [Chitinimonas sp.]|uniref:cell envelope integrity protein CreD n=1 Tax=Chitinimonas sp. TaxID=1934313 RepID=UPI002F930D21